MKGIDKLIEKLLFDKCPYEYDLNDILRNNVPCENDHTITGDKSKCKVCWRSAIESEHEEE